MEDIAGIYKIENLINGKVYIGQSIHIFERWKQERSGSINKHVKNAFLKYGLNNFSFEVLEEISLNERKKLDQREKFFIKLLDSTNPYKGYNLESGGNKNKFISETTRKKMSIARKKYYLENPEAKKETSITTKKAMKNPEIRKKLSENNALYWKGRTRSEKTKNKLSIAHTGKKFSEKHKQKLSIARKKYCQEHPEKAPMRNPETVAKRVAKVSKKVKCLETGITYLSVNDAGRKLNLDSRSISSCCNGKQKTTGHLHFRFA
jgi:group I intron endonuclease